MKAETQSDALGAGAFLRSIAVWGPGLLVMLADTDAGNVVTAAQSGAQWGYRLLPLVLMLIPMLYMVQELTVRLGISTGRGHGELIRTRFGLGWARLSTLRPGRRRHRLACHRVHRRRRRRRAVRPLPRVHAAPRRGDAAHHRGQRVLQAGRAGRAVRRPVRTGVLRRRLGRAPGPRGAGAGRDRPAAPETAIFCSWPRRSSARPSTRG